MNDRVLAALDAFAAFVVNAFLIVIGSLGVLVCVAIVVAAFGPVGGAVAALVAMCGAWTLYRSA